MRLVGQRAWRLAALPLLLPAWRSHGTEDVGPVAAARQRGLRGRSWRSGDRRLTEEPQDNLTDQLQELECATAYFSCDCAATDGCRWFVYAGGVGGYCAIGEGGVSCNACDTQAVCPAGRCLSKTSACDCVGDDDADCSWDEGSGTCELASPTLEQRCGACPTLAVCAEAFPQAVSFDPSRGGVADGRYVSVTFDSGLDWCATSGSPSLWCGSQDESQIVSRSYITLENNVLTVDISASLPTIATGGLTCGLDISSGLLCTASNDPFLGLSADADYSFSVIDKTGPAITGYSPRQDSYTVPADGWVTLSFSEVIFKFGGESGDSAVQATLGRLAMDWSGANTGQVSTREEVRAEIVQETKLRVLLAGLVQPEIWYTLSVPAASLEDTSGNKFTGLSEGAYAFRVTHEFVAQNTEQAEFAEASDGLSTGAAVGVAAAVFGLCSMAAFWLRRRAKALDALRVQGLRAVAEQKSEVPAKVRVPKVVATASLEGPAASASSGLGVTTPPPSVAWQHPGGDDATMWARPSQRNPSAGASPRPGDRPSPTEGGARRAPPTSAPGTSPRDERPWEDRPRRPPSERGAQGQPPPRQPPAGGPASGARIGEPPRAQARQARNEARSASSQPPPGGGSEPQQDPHQTTAACPPEAKSVESKLRSTMGAPLEERKKVYKALLLEYHPDKNSDPAAKEVFQYVNGARDWYLHVPS